MSVLNELQEAVAAVAASVGPSVVGIGSRLRGSGVVVADGRVLTNAHNLRGGEVTVRFPGGRTAVGTAKGVDWDGDLAVVEVDTAGAPAIAWSSGSATIGSAVFAAAATSCRRGARVSFGFVSSVERAFRGPGGRRISGSLEHTAPLAPGSSGSPLLDADGALVGLSTNRVGEGFYLALPADDGAQGPGRRAGPRRDARAAAPRASRSPRRTSPAACAGRSACRSATGVLVRGVEDGQPRGRGRHPGGRPPRRRGRQADPRHRRPPRPARRRPACRSRSRSSAAPRSGPSRSRAGRERRARVGRGDARQLALERPSPGSVRPGLASWAAGRDRPRRL